MLKLLRMRHLSFLVFGVLVSTLATAAQFKHPERGFSFSYDDKGWEKVELPADGKAPGQDVDRTMAQMTLVSLQMKKADDKYRSRFSVVVDSLKKFPGTPAEQLKAYQKHTVEFMKGQRFHVLSVDPIKLPMVAAPAFEIRANQRDFGLSFRQVVFLKGQEAYLLTVATRTAKFDEYLPQTRQFFETFQIP